MRKVIVSSLRPLEPLAPTRDADLEVKVAKYLPPLLDLLSEAGEKKSDIVCLPEDYFFMRRQAVDVPCGLTEEIAKKAKQHQMYVIFPVMEHRQDGDFNTCLIYDRQGSLLGRYDKCHPTPGESQYSLPGNDLPVFQLDFGTIGFMVCLELYFQEVARVAALKGAEIIFFPNQNAEPSERIWETLVKARALDNCVYVVTSSFGVPEGLPWHPGRNDGHYEHDGYYRNVIVGRDGHVIADGGYNVGMTTAEIDLDAKHHVYNIAAYGCSDLRQHLFDLRRPELYGEVTEKET